MNKFSKYTILAILLNVVFIILLVSPVYLGLTKDALSALIFAFAIAVISICIQFIVGLTFLQNEKRKPLGQAMLMAIGIMVLIGFSLCSGC